MSINFEVIYSTIQMFSVSKIFVQQGCIKLMDSGSKDIYNVTKDMYHGFHKNVTVFIMDNHKKCFLSPKSTF